jgi:hypothetical protein
VNYCLRICATVSVMLLWVAPLQALELAERFDNVTSIRSDLWTGTRSLDEKAVSTVSAWLKGKLFLDERYGKVVYDGWGRKEAREKMAYTDYRVRELYWTNSIGSLDIKLGRIMTAWGRADGINPTDNLSPRDFTLLVPEDGDFRYGNEAIQISYARDNDTFSIWWFPKSASNTLPLPNLPSVQYLVQAPPEKSQRALRWDYSANNIDASVSYFEGNDLMPDLSFTNVDSFNRLQISLANNPIRVLGTDLSVNQGDVIWRAEAALTDTATTGNQDFNHKKRQFMAVAGPEKIFDGVTVGTQAVIQRVFNFTSPDNMTCPFASCTILQSIARQQAALSNQTRAEQYGIVLRVAKRWLGDNLLTELSCVSFVEGKNSIVRTKIDYAIDDNWHVQGGSEMYFGETDTFFGQLRDNNLAYFQVRYTY